MKNIKILFLFLCLNNISILFSASKDCKNLYLELMKKILINSIYEDPSIHPLTVGIYNSQNRENGRDWPKTAHTMIGLKRMNNIQYCIDQILKNDISGDFLEAGVWRGGAVIFMKAILHAYEVPDRIIWVADSFEGLPAPDAQNYPADKDLNLNKYKELAISLDDVKNNFKKYDLLDNQVKFLKGWFKDTLPYAAIKKLSLLRIDADLYESTIQALTYLYPKLSVGGFVIIDDYGTLPACKKAVDDFRLSHFITDKIEWIDLDGIFWKKSGLAKI